MKNRLVYLSLIFLCCQNAWADGALNQQDDLKDIDRLPNIEDIKGAIPSYEIDLRTNQRKLYSEKELLENKQKLEQLLYLALLSQDIANVGKLRELYSTLDKTDLSLIDWADAMIVAKNDLAKSIELYRKLIAKLPNIAVIRFQLATVLFYNKEYEAAKDQFEKLRAESDLTDQDTKMLDSFLSAISSKDKWAFNFALNYLHDNNIGNSVRAGTKYQTSDGGSLTIDEGPEKASGYTLQLGADKRWSMANGKFASLGFNSNLNYYYNNKKYNELNLRLSSGFGYENPRFSHSINPYIAKRLTALNSVENLRAYSETVGTNYVLSNWLLPNLRYSFYWDMSYEHYRKKNQASQGMTNLISNSLFYLSSPQQYWMLSYDAIKRNTKENYESFLHNGVRLSWGQEWPLGISTSASVGVARKNYEDGRPFGIGRLDKRKAKEYSGRISVWHRAVHLGGITPRLTWTYRKVKNNVNIYDYDNNKLFLEFSKMF